MKQNIKETLKITIVIDKRKTNQTQVVAAESSRKMDKTIGTEYLEKKRAKEREKTVAAGGVGKK